MIVHPLKRSLFIPGRGTEVFFKGGGVTWFSVERREDPLSSTEYKGD